MSPMRNFKKSLLFVVIALIGIIAAFCWRNTAKNKSAAMAAGRPPSLGIPQELRKSEKNKSTAVAAGKPQLVVETGHSGFVNSMSFSPDGKTLVSGGWDHTIRLWDVATGTEIRVLKGHIHPVFSVAFSPDSKMLASEGGAGTIQLWDVATQSWRAPANSGIRGDGTIKLWDVATGAEIRTFTKHPSYVRSVVFSPDGKTLAGGRGDHIIKLWEVATGTEIRTFTGRASKGRAGEVHSIAFTPDGKMMASGGWDGTIRLWDVATGAEIRTLTGSLSNVNSVVFSPDGKTLASGSDNDTIKLWDVRSGTEIRTLKGHLSDILSVAFSPDGKTLVSGSRNRTIKLWEVATGAEIRTTMHQYSARCATLSPDGKTLASGFVNGIISLLNVATDTEIYTLTGEFDVLGRSGYFDPVNFVALSPDGKTLAIGSWNTIKLRDVANDTEIRTLTGHIDPVLSVAFSPNSKILASGDTTELKLWDVATGAEIRSLTGRTRTGHPYYVRSIAFSPDGKRLASRSFDDTIKLWDVATGAEVRTFKGYADVASSIAFSRDGKILANGSNNDTINLWDVATGTKIRTHKGPTYVVFSDGVEARSSERGHSIAVNSVVFSPNGKTLASGWHDHVIRLWDVTTGALIRTFEGHTGDVNSVTLTLDGKTLISGSSDHTIKLWNVATGAEIRTLTGHAGVVNSIALTPDGKTLVSGSEDNTIKLWNVATGVELASLVSFRDSSWVMVTPDGRFDTNRIDDIKGLHWLMPDAPLTPVPIEIFMRDYYEPKLLPRILAREKFKPVRDFSTLNRTQPEVGIVNIVPDSASTIQVTVEVANVKSAVQQDTAGKPLESGVYDVRLFRDGQLVDYAPANDGEVKLNANGKATLKFSHIKWPRTGIGLIEFSTYAFNGAGIKSATDRQTYALMPKPTPVKGRAYVISLGVNAYQREDLNLRYAANDARQMQESLVRRLAAQGEYQAVVGVPLISDYTVTLADGRTVAAHDPALDQAPAGQKHVTENRATKAHLRAVLNVLAGRRVDAALLKDISNADKLRAARPEDLVLISVSSHGYRDDRTGIFYLVPSDSGTAPSSSPSVRNQWLSSDELSRWLRDVDAGELVLIVDACHSAAAVEGTDFKPGPMGSRGLGQLSYDKSMRILVATQAKNSAIERDNLRQGLLTYALLQDGLGAWRADYKPKDKVILLAEWLSYGVERVPRLYKEKGIIRETVDPRERKLDNDKTQQPVLFDFARRQREVVLARQP